MRASPARSTRTRGAVLIEGRLGSAPPVSTCAMPRPRGRPAWSTMRVVVQSGRALAAPDRPCDRGRTWVRSDPRHRQFVTQDVVRRPHGGRIATSFSWGHLRARGSEARGKERGGRWPPTGDCQTVVHPFPFGWASFTGTRPVGEPNRGAGGARPRRDDPSPGCDWRPRISSSHRPKRS